MHYKDSKERPMLLSEYLQVIGYDIVQRPPSKSPNNQTKIYHKTRHYKENGIHKTAESTVIIKRDCLAINATKAVIKGKVRVKGEPVHWEQLMQGWRVKHPRQDQHVKMLSKITMFKDGQCTTRHGFSPFNHPWSSLNAYRRVSSANDHYCNDFSAQPTRTA